MKYTDLIGKDSEKMRIIFDPNLSGHFKDEEIQFFGFILYQIKFRLFEFIDLSAVPTNKYYFKKNFGIGLKIIEIPNFPIVSCELAEKDYFYCLLKSEI
jgi:hypothetical protein